MSRLENSDPDCGGAADTVIKCGGYFATLNYLLPFLVADMTCMDMCRGITFAINACQHKKVSSHWSLH